MPIEKNLRKLPVIISYSAHAKKERKFRSVEVLRINQVKEELRSEEVATEQPVFALMKEREGERC